MIEKMQLLCWVPVAMLRDPFAAQRSESRDFAHRISGHLETFISIIIALDVFPWTHERDGSRRKPELDTAVLVVKQDEIVFQTFIPTVYTS